MMDLRTVDRLMVLISLHFSFAQDGEYNCTMTECRECARRGAVMIVIDRNIKVLNLLYL